MKTIKRILVQLMGTLLLVGYLSSCSNPTNTQTAPGQMMPDGQNTSESSLSSGTASLAALSKVEPITDTWDDATATHITLGDSPTIKGDGAEASGQGVTITAAGTYVISGTATDGQILINAPETAIVHLVLSGLTLTNTTGAPIYAISADDLIITLAKDTINTLTDGGANFVYTDTANEEPNAALFAKCDLAINGSGSLVVNAGFNNGIGSKDDLAIIAGNYTINAKNHGLRGRDSVTVLGGEFNITAGNDGIQTNNTEDPTKGWITIENGNFVINAAHDGIQAETSLTVMGGSFDLTTGGGLQTATTPAKTTTTVDTTATATTAPPAKNPAEPATTTTTATTESYKGLKAGTEMTLSGGSFVLVTLDDAIHAGGNIQINDGQFTINTGDDGVHADGDLTVSGGQIDVLSSYEGLEASTMTLASGIINLATTDDGINISGGNDAGAGGAFGGDQFSQSSDHWLKITGGTITVVAGSDAIDINGSGEMTGGTVNLTAATLGEGQTLDSDGTFTRTGGDLTETGGTAMGGGAGGMGRQRPQQ